MFDKDGYLSWIGWAAVAAVIFILGVLTYPVKAEEVSGACKLPVQEEMMEHFKANEDKYNVFFTDKPELIREYLDVITEELNPGKDVSSVKEIHKKLLPDFGKLFIYVNKNVGQMMLWIEDKKGCYMGHGKHLDIWEQIKLRMKGV